MVEAELTRDKFLGGRIHAWQPRAGYRAGVDAVFLAAAVPAQSGDQVLELGCGAGVASLCLASRVEGIRVTGVEVQAFYADLARRNAEENALPLEIVEADLSVLPADLRQRSFDHVIANPPYFDRNKSQSARDLGREIAFGEATPLAQWIEVAARRLKHRGVLTMIQRTDRLSDILNSMDHRLGSFEILPLAPREDRRSKLVLLRAIKGGRAPLALLPAVRLHEGTRHLSDDDDYCSVIEQVLREGAKFPWPDG